MRRRFAISSLGVVCMMTLSVGCQQPAADMQGPPPRPAELDKLDSWTGSWSGSGDLTMFTPEGPRTMKTSGTEEVKWVCDNRWLMSTYEWSMGEEDKYQGHSYMTYCPKEKEYKNWSFSNMGSMGHGEMDYDEKAGLWRMEGRESKPDGSVGYGEGTVKMSADGKTSEWCYTEWDSPWKFKKVMEVKGTSTKH